MQRVFRVFTLALKRFYEEIWILAGISLLWLALSLPLITLPPATAALFYSTNRVVQGRVIKIEHFFAAFREYFTKSWQLAAIGLGTTLVIVINLCFYALSRHELVRLIAIPFGSLLLFWLGMNVYTFPLLIAQEDKKIVLILKNAALLTLANPLFTFALLSLLALIILIGAFITGPFLLVSPSIIATIESQALATLLADLGNQEA